jgi:hypothetical protein
MSPEGLSFSNIFKYFKIKIRQVILTGMPLDLSPSEEKRSKSKSKLFLRFFKLYRVCFSLRPLTITCNEKSFFY